MGRNLFLLYLLVVISASWYLHRNAGLGMPLPWADECLFVLPALNLADHHTLFTPQINPERHLMWMPPGYSIVLSVVYTVLPYSLQLARDVSWLFIIILFLGLLRLLKGVAPQSIVIVFVSVFLLSTNFTVAGNTARMDALLACSVCWGWFLTVRGNSYYGIGILLISTLIHPYGLYFLGGSLLYLLAEKRGAFRRPTRLEILFAAAAGLSIAAYLIYVLQHRGEFLQDMQFQLERKSSRDILERLRNDTTMIVLLAGYVLTFPFVLKFARDRIDVLIFGGISLAIQLFGLEMWYHIYVAIAALILLVLITGLTHDAISRTRVSAVTRWIGLGAVLLSLLFVAYDRGFVPSPKRYPDNLRWLGMTMDPKGEYISNDERRMLVDRLNAIAADQPSARVAFNPEGDALAVWNKDCIFTPYYPMFTTTEPDIVVLHISSFLPNWWRGHTEETRLRWKVDEGDLAFTSDDGDQWYIKQVTK